MKKSDFKVSAYETESLWVWSSNPQIPNIHCWYHFDVILIWLERFVQYAIFLKVKKSITYLNICIAGRKQITSVRQDLTGQYPFCHFSPERATLCVCVCVCVCDTLSLCPSLPKTHTQTRTAFPEWQPVSRGLTNSFSDRWQCILDPLKVLTRPHRPQKNTFSRSSQVLSIMSGLSDRRYSHPSRRIFLSRHESFQSVKRVRMTQKIVSDIYYDIQQACLIHTFCCALTSCS